LINTVLPGIIPTNIIPQVMLDAVSPECLAPVSAIVAACHKLLSDANRQTGQAIECSAEKRMIVPQTPYMNGRISKRAVTVWEPLFKTSHGEDSNIEDAIP
jgi:hypothetical protein